MNKSLEAVEHHTEYYLKMKKYYDSQGIDWQYMPDRGQIELALLMAPYTTYIQIEENEERSKKNDN